MPHLGVTVEIATVGGATNVSPVLFELPWHFDREIVTADLHWRDARGTLSESILPDFQQCHPAAF